MTAPELQDPPCSGNSTRCDCRRSTSKERHAIVTSVDRADFELNRGQPKPLSAPRPPLPSHRGHPRCNPELSISKGDRHVAPPRRSAQVSASDPEAGPSRRPPPFDFRADG